MVGQASSSSYECVSWKHLAGLETSQEAGYGQTFFYGVYPQKVVDDAELITHLNNQTRPTTPSGWYSYGRKYYAKVVATPNADAAYNVFDNGTTIVNGETYWFECTPIEWLVASDYSRNRLATSSMILDVAQYATNDNPNCMFDTSNLREFLNEDFFKSAFIFGSPSSNLDLYTADNSTRTTIAANPSSQYKDENNGASTTDYVTSACYADRSSQYYTIQDSFDDSDYVKAKPVTDYAKAKGAKMEVKDTYGPLYGGGDCYKAPYWLRSTAHNDGYKASYIASNGNLGVAATTELLGVAPVIQFKWPQA